MWTGSDAPAGEDPLADLAPTRHRAEVACLRLLPWLRAAAATPRRVRPPAPLRRLRWARHRYQAKRTVMDACWIWLKARNPAGYGILWRGYAGSILVHRAVWQAHNGVIPREMELHHLCGNKACYNLAHLMCVGHLAHAFLDGRVHTHCVNGHEYTSNNTYWRTDRKQPTRQCVECRRACKQKRRQIVYAPH